MGMLVLLSFFTHQLLPHTACFTCSLTDKETAVSVVTKCKICSSMLQRDFAYVL